MPPTLYLRSKILLPVVQTLVIVLTWLGNGGPEKKYAFKKNYSHLNEQTPKFEGGCIKR